TSFSDITGVAKLSATVHVGLNRIQHAVPAEIRRTIFTHTLRRCSRRFIAASQENHHRQKRGLCPHAQNVRMKWPDLRKVLHMLSHIFDWLNLVVRWIHVIVGVAWIGASFYFVWLEYHLERYKDSLPK